MQRSKNGSVVQDKRSKVWNFYWWEDGKRRSKQLGRFSTKTAAWHAAQPIREQLRTARAIKPTPPNVAALVEAYRVEKMPKRAMTRQGYNTWLTQYVLPVWGSHSITELTARPVDLWLQSLPLAAKSKVHIRGMVRLLWDFAMYRGDVPTQRNPMELVIIRGASKRTRQVRSLTVGEFQKLIDHLEDPMRTIARVCVCFGLRISEALALRWADIDWINGTISVERSIVHQIVDETKTPESQRVMTVDGEMLDALKTWKLVSPFSSPADWLFASPRHIGRLPFSYSGVWQSLRKAGVRAGIGTLASHTFRHTHRTWLDSFGTPVGIQQRLMRHSDIRTTMNTYGTADSADMRVARGKIVRMALGSA